MRKAVMILLSGGYLFLALALAALFWLADSGWGAGAAALIAALGLFFGLHNMIARGTTIGELRRELAGLADAHGLLADQLEDTQAALEAMADSLHRDRRVITPQLLSGACVTDTNPAVGAGCNHEVAGDRDRRGDTWDAMRSILATCSSVGRLPQVFPGFQIQRVQPRPRRCRMRLVVVGINTLSPETAMPK